MKFNKLVATSAFGLIASAGAAFASDCGSISIAEMNWASAELMANVDAIILEEGYGCDVELIPGATQTTFASMSEKGVPDIAPELWINAVATPLAAAKEEGSLVALNGGPITGLGEGWWITKKFKEDHPELDTVEKLLAHPELFPYVEDDAKGAFMGCPAGWGCQLINANLFRAYGMEDKGWVLVDPGSAAGLDGSIAKAVERDEPWFGYYWSPTSIIGKYELQMLPFEAEYAGNDNWNNCVALAEQDCLDPQPTSWIESEVESVVTDDFVAKAGPAADYFKARVYPGEVMNAMLVYMTDNQATGEDAAYEFLETQGDLWTQWVPADVAEKVKAGL
ncbi:ABC transporter substrate-binding protein [Pacificibacter marinus]|uniref:Glycine betaine transporter periplasmic subunit n=1 Tax=Pacificibacter marinus TaxID=658057 RepID=A0A1Y5TQ28_9RHOB|nr:ABC transporter substrate-binding protein [Pacificibacter marinus]SEL36275.1 glycine betaine/proline transport system substrate-binding protein [Pacificibacter marinus]SLN69290.1 glycine betaine transporter periplasmic subunit [Pacificibacter marinus]